MEIRHKTAAGAETVASLLSTSIVLPASHSHTKDVDCPIKGLMDLVICKLKARTLQSPIMCYLCFLLSEYSFRKKLTLLTIHSTETYW